MRVLLCSAIIAFFLLFSAGFREAAAQEEQDFDETLVFLEIPGFGGFEIPAVIKGSELYLSVPDLFDFLKVRNFVSPGMDSVYGFFINREANYLISHTSGRIRFQERIYTVIKGDIIKTETNLYLKNDYLGRVFGLECSFNFRSLTVTLRSKLELPVIKEMKLEEMRKNLTRLKGEVKADTNLVRTHPLLRFGMADWSVVGTEEINGKSDVRLNLSLGAMVAGGEANASLYYNSRDPLSEKQQHYLWRYVDNDFRPLRQIMAGKISTQAVSSLYNPVVGVQLTNTPTTFRRSFGSYKLSDRTEPGWIVELYVNNELVDYMKADASGFFSFDIPLVYGNSSVKLKFFGPWGEERTREQNINIPYNFLPPKTFEYNVSAGIVEDTLFSRFSRAVFNYGVTRSITMGGGIEYLSSVSSGPAMPFVSSSFRVTNNLLLSGEFTFGVRAKGSLVLRLPSNLQLDLNYTWYDKDQKAINYIYREERKAALSAPLKIGRFSSYNRLSFYQVVLPVSQYTTGEWLFSGSLFGINTNITSYALFTGNEKPYVYSNLAAAFRLPARFVLMPQLQYGYTQGSVLSAKLRLEKIFGSKTFFTIQYEQNFKNNLRLAEVGIRHDFSFAQAGMSFRQTNSKPSFIEYARGSLISDTKTGFVTTDNRPNVGRGGITVIAYLDMNSNGGRDPGEPRAAGLNIHTNGGRILKSEADTVIRILGLEPYTSCLIELDPEGFESVSWRLPVKSLSVMVDPNIIKVVEIPIAVSGEASGRITRDEAGVKTGLGRIILEFRDEMNNLVSRTMSEDDGYYSYMGLAPGKSLVRPDTSQLRKLQLYSEPSFREFYISAGREGDYVADLDFTLYPVKKDTVARPVEKPAVVIEKPVEKPVQPQVRKDTTYTIIHEVTQELVTITQDSYAVQLGAFRKRSNAESYRKTLETLLGTKVEIIVENDLYKVRVTGLKERDDVTRVVGILQKNGVTELWIIAMKAKQQQWVLIEKQDTIAVIGEVPVDREPAKVTPEMAIQLGAFRRENNARELKLRLSRMINKPVIIVQEDGYYKVRVTGFTSREELQKMVPVLQKLGMKDIWIPAVKEQPIIVQPVIPKPDTLERKPEKIYPDTAKAVRPVVVHPAQAVADTTEARKEQVKEEPPAEVKPSAPKPTISLHVGEFRKRSQALRAQRKVASKFDVTVDLYMRWDSYHLVIRGFYNREDTFRYYPELAGMGYTNIYVIQEK